VSLNCYLWSGQLSFELYRSSEPKKALLLFHDLIRELGTDSGFDRICTLFEIETAQASIAYRFASNQSTASTLISTCLRTSLQGYRDLDDYSSFISQLYKLTREDLKRVYKRYFTQFLSSITEPVTIMTCPASTEGVESLLLSFSSFVAFKEQNLADFAL
jgi:Zn-dependent M16 (insulinase) family peptidase